MLQERWEYDPCSSFGIAFVTPEYNYGYPATIKNAIDYLHQEWKDKAAGFVSYGGIAAGTRAVQQLKQVITTLKMVPVFESVNIPFHTQFIRAGRFHANDVLERAATAMLDELLRVNGALRVGAANAVAGLSAAQIPASQFRAACR